MSKTDLQEIFLAVFPCAGASGVRCYTNVIFANGVVIVPQFPDVDPKADWEAIELYSSLLPDWEVVGVDCSRLNLRNGALHCITANIPPARWLKYLIGLLLRCFCLWQGHRYQA